MNAMPLAQFSDATIPQPEMRANPVPTSFGGLGTGAGFTGTGHLLYERRDRPGLLAELG